MSHPCAGTLVATKTPKSPFLKPLRAISLCFCGMSGVMTGILSYSHILWQLLGFFLHFTKYDSASLKTAVHSAHISNDCCPLSPVALDSQMLYSYCRFLRLFTNQVHLFICRFHVFLSNIIHPIGASCRKKQFGDCLLNLSCLPHIKSPVLASELCYLWPLSRRVWAILPCARHQVLG